LNGKREINLKYFGSYYQVEILGFIELSFNSSAASRYQGKIIVYLYKITIASFSERFLSSLKVTYIELRIDIGHKLNISWA